MKKVGIHILFWISYTLIFALISTAFASTTDMTYPPMIRFGRYWLNEIGMLPLKTIAAYGFILWIVPNFFLKAKNVKGTLISIIGLLIIVILYRLQIYYVAYPLMYDEFPHYFTLEPKRILYSMVDVVPPIALLSTIQLINNKIQSQHREKELLHQKLESELRYLKAQTNPHFLFNTLNNIYALARKNSPNTSEAILHLSDILRFMLYECSSKRISIASEVKIIKDYIQLEKIRFNKKLRLLDQYEMDNPSQLVAPMILLPLVENAFKHGVGNSRFESEIDIKLKLDQGNLNFSIRNTFEIDQGNKEFEGIGIANVRRQLELIYPDKHSFEISRDDGIFSIKMKINLNRQNGQA
tara:strand:+ start:306 stop:1367 length:1062 start_codon:yes stop_codon:yes gene_type:complete